MSNICFCGEIRKVSIEKQHLPECKQQRPKPDFTSAHYYENMLTHIENFTSKN